MSSNEEGAGAILKMMFAAHTTAILGAGIETGIFAAIAEGPMNIEQIAKRIDCPARSTRILLEALVALDLLVEDADCYALSPLAANHLIPGIPGYAGDFWSVLGRETVWTGLSNLTRAVRSGGTLHEQHAETPLHPHWETFARSSASISIPAATAIEKALHDFVAEREHPSLLDIAAGSGIYGYTFAKAHPHLQLAFLDWPNVLPHTRSWAEKFDVDPERVNFIAGDMFTVDYQGQYDVVILSNVFHHFDPPTCIKLMEKVAASIKPGGRIVIHDFFKDDGRPRSRLFGVTMLMWTRGGDAYTSENYSEWLSLSGFDAPEVHTPEILPTSFLIARRR